MTRNTEHELKVPNRPVSCASCCRRLSVCSLTLSQSFLLDEGRPAGRAGEQRAAVAGLRVHLGVATAARGI